MDELEGRNTPEPVEVIEPRAPRLKTLKNGAIYDLDKGRIVANPGGGTHAITSDNAHSFLARRRVVGLRAQLAGLAEAVDIDPSDVDDELLLQSGTALQALTAHMARTFKESKSLRGMAEVYDKLAAPLVGDRRQRDDDQPIEQVNVMVLIHQLVQQINVSRE